jgi:hypothetical protein
MEPQSETATETVSPVQVQHQPLLTEREADRFRRSRQVRRVIGVLIIVMIALVAIRIGPRVVRHLDAATKFSLIGGTVEWSLDADDWRAGGGTYVGLSGGMDMVTDLSLTRLHDLHNVVSLDLSECHGFTDAGLATLENLRGLRELNLTRVELQQRFLKLEAGPKLTDEALDHVGKMTQLTNLSLEGNLITDDGLAKLAGLTNLVFLDLHRTRVTDKGLKHLEKMKRLKHLILTETQVTKKGIQELEAKMGGIEGIVLDADEAVIRDEAGPE